MVNILEGTHTFNTEGNICKLQVLVFACFVNLSNLINHSQNLFPHL